MKTTWLYSFIFLLFLTGCSNCPDCPECPEKQESTENTVKQDLNQGIPAPQGETILIADTITYDVTIMSNDNDDEYIQECLKNTKPAEMIDFIFDQVYKGKIIAYSVLTGAPLSIDEVKEIEAREDFSRTLIGRCQFVETWTLDKENFSFHKEVHEMLIAYEKLNDQAEVIGYTAAFKIKFKELKNADAV
ncbi:MAG: hypothetical protein C0594_02785 [Marinilabiliales bacterium]|nr:MAG: hypothetical protein C0594_02785 [Marinilabiliales bacterium]